MSRTYKATGINLKSMPMGESDRLLTILTREFGLIRAVAMGSRKHNSRLGGRSELFVVNDLLIAKGRSLDKVAQAETLESYPRLGQDLKKLIASQYLAELCLGQALSDQPQEELFCLLNEHLGRLERSPASQVLPLLTHAVFQLLILAGVAPQVHVCCITRQALALDYTNCDWRIGFSIPAGGTVTLASLERLIASHPSPRQRQGVASTAASIARQVVPASSPPSTSLHPTGEPNQTSSHSPRLHPAGLHPVGLNMRLNAAELMLLQQLAAVELPTPSQLLAQLQTSMAPHNTLESVWQSVERTLRFYAQYHLDRPIRSAAFIDACFDPID